MQNDTWVCFDCRTAARRAAGQFFLDRQPPRIGQANPRVPCPTCGAACRFLGQTRHLPRKTAVKAWDKLRERVETEAVAYAEELAVENVRWRHLVERGSRERLDELESRPPNPQRTKMIAAMKRNMASS